MHVRTPKPAPAPPPYTLVWREITFPDGSTHRIQVKLCPPGHACALDPREIQAQRGELKLRAKRPPGDYHRKY